MIRTLLFVVNLVVLAAVLLFGFGVPLLWVLPGLAVGRSRGRRLTNTVGWLAWLGPLGLLPVCLGERQLPG